ncbi:MAG: sugar transferase [Parvularculaceae bacterium]
MSEAATLSKPDADAPVDDAPATTVAPSARRLKILVVSSLTRSLVNFRRTLLRDLTDGGRADVVACGPEDDADVVAVLARMGVGFRRIPMKRASTNPISDAATLRALWSLIRRERADVVVAYTQKPIIYGGVTARLAGAPRFFALQSGLGYTFSEENKSGLLRRTVSVLYRAALDRADALFVFNGDDEADMRRHGMLRRRQRVVQVPGSGVDKDRFPHDPTRAGAPVFLLVARLMRDKGLYEFVEAARAVKADHPDARFQILGPFDANPASIRAEDLEAWKAEGVVEYLGETKDVRPCLAAASVFVLPSYHREGLPRAILEALSTGRAVITTTMPGCRETVDEGDNGYLVPPKDAAALAQAMRRFAADHGLAARMGAASRKLVETKFDVDLVNDVILKTMGLRAVDGGPGPLADDVAAERERRAPFDARRAVDIVVASAGLVVAAPGMLALAVGVAATMGRPVVFRQRRAGLKGAPFELVKFRSMTNARGSDGELLPDADRITPFGAFLRRSRLDELPELWNIVRGRMSFVGPRPLLPTSPPNLGPLGAVRLETRPGLTGLAQVNGNARLEDDEKLALDVLYVRTRSLWLDVKIVLKTIWVVIMDEKVDRDAVRRALRELKAVKREKGLVDGA